MLFKIKMMGVDHVGSFCIFRAKLGAFHGIENICVESKMESLSSAVHKFQHFYRIKDGR